MGILGKLVFTCNSTYETAAGVLSLLMKFEFDKSEREAGVHSVAVEFAAQIAHQPILFIVNGFYVITKSFLASVGLPFDDDICSLACRLIVFAHSLFEVLEFLLVWDNFQIITGIMSCVTLLVQFYEPTGTK